MQADLWIRARSGQNLGIGHRVRAIILANALADAGTRAGLILDEDAPPAPAPLAVFRLPPGLIPPDEAAAYPGGLTPVVLDLSHPSMVADLPELVRRLHRQGRRVGLIDGLGPEAYAPEDSRAAVQIALTPYLLEPGAPERTAKCWLSGPGYAVLEPVYDSAPRQAASSRDRALLVCISGTDPWDLTEAAAKALRDGGLPGGWTARLVAGPGFDLDRRRALHALIEDTEGLSLLIAPSNLRVPLLSARLAVLGPGLVKYEAAACGVFSLIVAPDAVYGQMNQPFADAGLAQLLPAGPPEPEILHDAILAADARARPDPRQIIDGGGARRAAARFISELFTESGDV